MASFIAASGKAIRVVTFDEKVLRSRETSKVVMRLKG